MKLTDRERYRKRDTTAKPKAGGMSPGPETSELQKLGRFIQAHFQGAIKEGSAADVAIELLRRLKRKEARHEVPKFIVRVFDVRKAPMVEVEVLATELPDALENGAQIARQVFNSPEEYKTFRIHHNQDGHHIDMAALAYQEAGTLYEETTEVKTG